ncbi:MAG: hypothetical protein GY796_03665 [Chloroflexi bacterium]|nr:hypothetical protein [Chloroflexota bacterium]
MKKQFTTLLILLATLLILSACGGSPPDTTAIDNAKATAAAAEAALADAVADSGAAADLEAALAAAEAAAAEAAAAVADSEEAQAALAAAQAEVEAAQAEVEAAQAAQTEAEEALAAANTPDTEELEEAESGEEAAAEDEVIMIQGRPLVEFYVDTCGGCHGAFREGTLGPALIPERLSADPNILFLAIQNGRPGTSMDPLGGEPALEDSEIEALVEYILSEPSEEAFVWGEEQIMDSVEFLLDPATLPDAPTHDGDMNNLMLVTERENRSIKVLDGTTHTDLGRIEATYRAHGYTFDPSNERWAYNLGRDGWLLKIDLYTLQPVAKTRIGIDARAIAISDDGKYVIGGNYIPNTAVILDTETMEPVKIIETEGNKPDGEFVKSRVGGINQTLSSLVGPYFLLNLKDAGQVWRVDYTDLDAPIVKLEGVGDILHESFLTPDQKIYYVASQASNWMAAIDVESMELITQIPAGEKPHPGPGAVWSWEGDDGTIYAATVHIQDSSILVWDTATQEEVASIPTGGPGLFINTNHNSPYVWADAIFSPDNPNTFYAMEKNPPFTVHEIHLDEAARFLHPEPTTDGQYVYISDWPTPEQYDEFGTGKVYVFDANTFEVVAVFEDIVTPTGIFNSSRRDETLGH